MARSYLFLPLARAAVAGFAFATLLMAPTAVARQSGEVVEFVDQRVTRVVVELEARTGYRFLYRDALVADLRVSFAADVDESLSELQRVLLPEGIHVRVDHVRRQVVLAPLEGVESASTLVGRVVDDDSGDPLPFATIAWTVDGSLTGVVTDLAGRFMLQVSGTVGGPDAVTVSYVGYQPLTVEGVSLVDGVTIRLRPSLDEVPEVVVSSSAVLADVDTSWTRVATATDLSLLGEANAIRALQALPAVSISGAFSNGPVVRGSRSDGFQVLLDGVPVYSPSHFFGLFDAFNADALRAVGLFYAVPPVEYAGTPGGTLSFRTRGGSRRSFEHSLGISSTSATVTMEGPLLSGRGSWLLSGRRSLFDVVDWFGNEELVSLGLDVDRESSAPPIVESLNDRVVRAGESFATFYDVHANALVESGDGGRWVASAYVGGDDTRQEADRFLLQARDSTRRIALEEVETANEWHNTLASVRREGSLGASGFYSFSAFYSGYRTRYAKDDFPFLRRSQADSRLAELAIDTLANRNSLDDLGGAFSTSLSAGEATVVDLGAELHRYAADYYEYAAGFNRAFDDRLEAWQADVFGALAVRRGVAHTTIGLRSHLYSADATIRLSPRVRLEITPLPGATLFVGFSRSYQFLHQLYLDTAADARIWTLSTGAEPPGSADHVTGGVRFGTKGHAIQVEAFHKSSDGIRQHETVVSRRRIRDDGLVLAPWVHDYRGRTAGIEATARSRFPLGSLYAAYALSKSELRHDYIQEGEWVFADWDRRHQLVGGVELPLSRAFDLDASWTYGSGAPNGLALSNPDESERLAPYHRLDVAVSARLPVGPYRMEASVALFNVYDRQNTWYRTAVGVLEGPLNDLRVRAVNVDVYDLGFRPSFSLRLSTR